MKIIVSGATGFLGGEVCRTFSTNHKIIATGRNQVTGKQLSEQDVEFIPCDLQKSKTFKLLKDHATEADAFIHCAALSSPWGKYKDFYDANVVATQNVLNLCLDKKIKRLIHISTPSIYISKKHLQFVKEDAPPPAKAINFYAETKLLAEKELLQKAQDLEVIILRPQAIVGAGDRAIFPRILKTAKKGFFPVIGDGLSMMDLTCVENVVESIRCSLEASEEACGQIYNITNDEPVLIYEMLRKFIGELNIKFKEKPLSFEKAYALGHLLEKVSFFGEPLLTRYTACVLGRTRTLDISKAKKNLKYKPKLSLQEGLNNFLSHIKQNETFSL